MIRLKFSSARFLLKHRCILSFLAIAWITGLLFIVYLINWRSRTKLEVQKLIQPFTYTPEATHLQPTENYKTVEAIDYCNPPNDIKLGQEGESPVNASLVFVAMMFRHGDRAPLRPIRNQTNIDCGTTDSPILNRYLKTLKNLRGSAKHLVPFTTFPLHPALQTCTISQMTLIGAHQHLMLGQALKKSYIEQHNLLSQNWTSNDIKVFSTIYSRTYQSAVAFLFGFLPTFNISSINIKPMPDNRFCMSKYYCKCNLTYQLEEVHQKKKEQLWLSKPEVMKIMELLNPTIKFLPNQLTIQDPFFMFDALMGYVCHAAKLPCVPGTNECATFEHVYKIISYLKWAEQEFLVDDTHRKAVILKTQGFLNHLIYNIDNYINGKHSVRLVLYSGHDVSLQPVLSVLGIYNGSLIPYASHIAFEVYRYQVQQSMKYAIKFIYKGRDVTKDISFCKPYFNPLDKLLNFTYGLCPLESFKKFVADLVTSIGFSSYQDACNSHLSFDRKWLTHGFH